MSSTQNNVSEELPKTNSPAISRLQFHSKSKVNKLIIFTLLFAVIGAITLFRSFAAPGNYAPHHTYTDWVWDGGQRGAVNNSIEGTLSILTDTTKVHPSIGYFYINGFFFECGSSCTSPNGSAYMGIQTNGEAGNYRGKVAIFSVFGAAISAEAGSAGSVCSLHGAGFDGFSHSTGSTCRIPLNWQAGEQYAVRTQLVGGDASTYTWQAVVRNNGTGQELVIGKIKTPISWSKIQGYLINQTEYYSAGRAECDAPYSKVVFGFPKLNGSLAPSSNSSYYGTYKGCNQSVITSTRSGIMHEMGNTAFTGAAPTLPAGGTYISDMNWTYASTGYGVITKDQSVNNNGTPINLAGKTYAKGIGTHAISDIRYNLEGKYNKFVSYVNLQYGASGTVAYQVWADGTLLFDSGTMDGLSYTKAINVDVTGKQELKLIVLDAGDGIGADWAAWADARLIASALADTLPPSTPSALASPSQTSTSINLTWAASTDNVGVSGYRIYRSDKGLAPIATVNATSYSNTGLSPNTSYSYNVTAIDAAGNSSQFSNQINVSTLSAPQVVTPPQNDQIPPTVIINSPLNNATISYVTFVKASSSDNIGVIKLEAYIDGKLSASSNTGTISYTWVSYYAAKGPHTITIKAYDAAGNVGQSSVTVIKQ